MKEQNKQIRYYTEFKIVKDSVKKLNPEFSLCTILVAYHGDNRNYTSISKKVFEESIWSLYGVPIVGEWIKKEEDQNKETWGSHGGRLIWDSEGIKYEQTTKPFGFVSERAYKNAIWVEVKEKDGHTVKEYLRLENCILWTGRYEECKSILDDNYGQSMEISIEDATYREDGYTEVNKFIFSALCILGTDVEPCFESAMIGRQYELSQFKHDVQSMIESFKNFNLTSTTQDTNPVLDNNTNKEPQKEEIKLVEFNQTVIDAVKNIVNSKNKYRKDGTDKSYDKYETIKATETEVGFIDKEDYKIYSTTYTTTMLNDKDLSVVVDFENAVEKSLGIVDKTDNGFNFKREVDTLVYDSVEFAVKGVENDEIAKLNQTITARDFEIERAKAELVTCKDQIIKLNKEKSEFEAKVKKDTIDTLVATYAKVIDNKCGDFAEYKARLDYSKDADLVETELSRIYSAYSLSKQKNSKYNFNLIESGIVKKSETPTDLMRERYGDAFDNL